MQIAAAILQTYKGPYADYSNEEIWKQEGLLESSLIAVVVICE